MISGASPHAQISGKGLALVEFDNNANNGAKSESIDHLVAKNFIEELEVELDEAVEVRHFLSVEWVPTKLSILLLQILRVIVSNYQIFFSIRQPILNRNFFNFRNSGGESRRIGTSDIILRLVLIYCFLTFDFANKLVLGTLKVYLNS